MKTHNPRNEQIKRAYLTYLAEAKGFSEATLDTAMTWITTRTI